MKKLFMIAAAVAFSATSAFSQCGEIPVNRVLLVGDSWAAFMNADQTITNALKNSGHSDKKYTSSFVIAENGADTWDFLDTVKQNAIQAIVDANPEIDIVHLSIGGNDLLGDWNTSFTQHETDSLELDVANRLDSIIRFLESTRPGMRVFWPGYTYPNFGEIIEDMAPAQSAHPFYGTWNGMGQPDFITINTILNQWSDSVALRAANDPLFDFVPAQGILQYQFGQAQPLGIAPGGTYAQFSAPVPIGYPDYPSPKAAMRPYGFFTDCFHLSTESYLYMLSYQTQKFYQKYFMDDMYLLSEGGTEDGSVSSAGSVSELIRMGESGGNEVAAVLTFHTQNMADTTLEAASIFLRRESVSGTNPITGNDLQVKMISGNFGTTADVEAEDFMAQGDVTDVPCRHGSNAADGHWIRLDLTADMLAHISPQASTQFVISVPGFTGGNVTFSDASDPELAPVLNLKYGTAPDGIQENTAMADLPVYPIPTSGMLYFGKEMQDMISIEVYNMLGDVVFRSDNDFAQIDISALPNGPYVLRIVTGSGTSSRRILKM